MKVKLVSQTQPEITNLTGEGLIVYIARVSNPSNQNNTETAPKLIRYLIENKHWSPFEMVDLTFEVQTTRAIAAQLLRHKTANFQEYSQRYSEAISYEIPELRLQSKNNRQSSSELLTGEQAEILNELVYESIQQSFKTYRTLLAAGVAREVARDVLPLCTTTVLYVKMNVRTLIHYLEVRDDEHTQKEHRLLAKEMKAIFKENFPIISETLNY
jgi:thymidylate synthase (FAD)